VRLQLIVVYTMIWVIFLSVHPHEIDDGEAGARNVDGAEWIGLIRRPLTTCGC